MERDLVCLPISDVPNQWARNPKRVQHPVRSRVRRVLAALQLQLSRDAEDRQLRPGAVFQYVLRRAADRGPDAARGHEHRLLRDAHPARRPVRGHDGRPGHHRGAGRLHQEPRAEPAAGGAVRGLHLAVGAASTSATRCARATRSASTSRRMFPHTFILVMASAVVAALVGIPIGIVSALKRRSPLIDYPLRIFALLGLSMPVFWLGILLLIVLLAPPGHLPAHRRRRSRRRHRHASAPARCSPYPGDFLAAVGRRALSPGAARPGAGLHAGRHRQPAVALGHAGGDQPGLHPHRARQGPDRADGRSTSTRCGT